MSILFNKVQKYESTYDNKSSCRFSLMQTIVLRNLSFLLFALYTSIIIEKLQMEYQKSCFDVLTKYKKQKAFSRKGEQQHQLQNSFIFDSTDKHIKKILCENKWKIIPAQAKSFCLKWIYMPKNNTFSELADNQRINHFPHTHILTTKLGLKRTLTGERSAHISWNGHYHGNFFPRSYDLSEEFDVFQKDFTRTAICNLAKKFMIAIQLEASSLFQHLSQSILCKKCPEQNWLQQARQLLDYNLMWEKEASVLKSCRLRLNSKIFQPLLCYLSILFTLDSEINEEDFSSKEIKELSAYSLHNPPYNNLNLHFEGSKQNAKLPSLSAIKLFFHLYKKCYETWGWFKSDGLRNIWVVKTSDSSRGRSIFLVESLEDARSLNNGMRLIQKYIEDVWIYRPHPTLKKSNIVRKLQNRKFDIRLWVTVKSFAPLEAFIFEEGYLRISQNIYQLMDITNEKSHLTNFSVNWNQTQDTEDSYLLLSDFLNFLQANNIKSSSGLKQQIQEVINQTLYSAELLTNSGDHRCFELFGFDIILDGDLKPWLLECNMSPACKERGVLADILEEMGTGLLSLHGLISKHPFQKKWQRITPSEYSTPDRPKYFPKNSKQNVGKDLYKSQNSIKSLKKCTSLLFGESNSKMQQSRINSILPAISNSSFHTEEKSLMITGTKISKSAINKLDSYHTLLEATIKIQRFARKQIKNHARNANEFPLSLSCLRLIEVLARVVKYRKGKHFKAMKRVFKRSKLLEHKR